MIYEDKILCLSNDDFFSLFFSLGAAPRWVTSAGKRSIQIIGKCHDGDNHSALFDPTTLKVNCFSECQGGMYLHTWILRALKLPNIVAAKDFLEDWMDGKEIDWEAAHSNIRFEGYQERPFKIEHIEPLPPMTQEELQTVWDNAISILDEPRKTRWEKEDKISREIMQKFDVKIDTSGSGIYLPHHNIFGGIVGVYLRSFLPLRKDVKEKHPEMPYQELIKFPRAKYVPVIRPVNRQTDDKTSWSFPNSYNLYGLHLAKDAIRETGIAIIFEGGKSVMLGHQYGYPYAVATHTYGAHLNHINMLIECGAKEIILAFDKQYEHENGQQYQLYERKTKELARKVKDEVNVSRIVCHHEEIGYKDAPIDRGKEIFERLFNSRERLVWNGEICDTTEEPKQENKPNQREQDMKEAEEFGEVL